MRGRFGKVLLFVTTMAVMFLGVIPMLRGAAVAVAKAASTYSFDASSGTLTITANGGSTEWRRDSSIDHGAVKAVIIGNGVTVISQSAFRECTSLTTAVFEDSAVSIGSYAFADCPALSAVNLGYQATYIGKYAFQNDISLTSLVLSRSMVSINEYAFYHSSVSDFTLTGLYKVPTWLSYLFNGNLSTYMLRVPEDSVSDYAAAKEDLTFTGSTPVIGVTAMVTGTASDIDWGDTYEDDDYEDFIDGTIQSIQKAEAGSLTISTDKYMSFNKEVLAALTERPDVTLTVNYKYEEYTYSFTIPAGADALSLVDGNGYCGFTYLQSLFGTGFWKE